MNPVTPIRLGGVGDDAPATHQSGVEGTGVAGPADRARHPAAGRWRIDIARAATVLLRQHRAEGPWPAVAALVTATRGASGQSPAAFAQRLGIEVAYLEQLERGLVAAGDLPPELTRAPWWASALRQLGAAATG